ncbi:MAG: hypothetical protein HYX87_03500 [Chloroflexi bacterium]|nr:hypothetical protein [Chloroflexota bacterium]
MSDGDFAEVLKRYTAILMSLPGVLGVAEGLYQGKQCIRVFVSKKSPELLRQIPEKVDGYIVRAEETGEFRATK